MATEYANGKIVTNGLVLSLDAADRNSYPGTGTTWRDMSGNGNNGTLTSGPTFNSNNGGSIVFDGSNDYVAISGTRTLTLFTMSNWIRRNGSQESYDGIFFSRATGVTGMNFGVSNKLGYHLNGNPSTYDWDSGLIIPDATWCMITYVQASTQAVLYINTTSATNAVGSSSTNLNTLELGRDECCGGRYFNGNIATAMLYNRNLSSTEVTQNYNALKSRFGL
jgi:hypothetical protein